MNASSRIFITGSADGLGKATAQTLLDEGHVVVVHVRSESRLTAVADLVARGAVAVVGDLADLDQTRRVAEQVNAVGAMDAVIHNAGIYTGPALLAVNVVVAPYVLTALIERRRSMRDRWLLAPPTARRAASLGPRRGFPAQPARGARSRHRHADECGRRPTREPIPSPT